MMRTSFQRRMVAASAVCLGAQVTTPKTSSNNWSRACQLPAPSAAMHMSVRHCSNAAPCPPCESTDKSEFEPTCVPKKHVVIVGGVAGGATAAARIHRLDPNNTLCTVIERGPEVSFANCGLPYHIGGEIKSEEKLHFHSAQSLNTETGAKVLIKAEVTSIDRKAKRITVNCWGGDCKEGRNFTVPYDKLILAPGAAPAMPPIPGLAENRDKSIFSLRTMEDMQHIESRVAKAETCAVIGGGFIGLEMCEQLQRLGKKVVLVEGLPHVMPPVDVDLSKLIERALIKEGVKLHLGDSVSAFEKVEATDGLNITLKSGATVNCDMAVMCIGVRAESDLAKAADLKLGERGHVWVNKYCQTSDPSIYAVGDVIESNDGVFPEFRSIVPLGNVANQQARIAADHAVTGSSLPYPGSIGTAIVRCFGLTCAISGWNEKRLTAAKIPFETSVVTAFDHAGYYPGATPVHVKLNYCPATGRVLGGQVLGENGVDKRIDIIATAITGKMTVEQLSVLQLSYAPPFGSARDVINIAALHARNKSEGLVKAIPTPERMEKDEVLLDVRKKCMHDEKPMKDVQYIPQAELHKRMDELDKDKNYVTVCQWGRLSYFSAMQLTDAGFNAKSLSGGVSVHFPEYDTPEMLQAKLPAKKE